MVGTVPVSGGLTMEVLAATLTRNEQDFAQLTALIVVTHETGNKSFDFTRPRGSVSLRRHPLPEAAPGGSGRAQLTPHAYLGDQPVPPFRHAGPTREIP